MKKNILADLVESAAVHVPKVAKKPKKLTEWVKNDAFDVLWKKYVPDSGDAETMFGEAVRGIGRLEYEYYNNGFGNAWNQTPSSNNDNYYGDDDAEENYDWTPDDFYSDLGRHVIKYLKNKAADAAVIRAAQDITPGQGGPEPWDRKADPMFGANIKILKNWMAKNEPTGDEK